jgi:hypothetical protein
MPSAARLAELARNTIEFVRRRKRDYTLTFNRQSPAAVAVLLDLAKFCRANQSTFHPDARSHAVLEGRREVWLRITNHLHLTTDELYSILGGATILRSSDGDTDDD